MTECVSGRKCVESIGGGKQAHPHTQEEGREKHLHLTVLVVLGLKVIRSVI